MIRSTTKIKTGFVLRYNLIKKPLIISFLLLLGVAPDIINRNTQRQFHIVLYCNSTCSNRKSVSDHVLYIL